MDAVLDRGVLGGQAEGIPAERVQHVVAAHPLHARHHVADDVVADVADVRVPGRIREHLEAVELRPRRIDVHLERAGRGPALLPLLVEFLRLVVGHRMRVLSGRRGHGAAAVLEAPRTVQTGS